MRARVIDHAGALIAEGTVRDATTHLHQFDGAREGIGVGRRSFDAPPSTGHCAVSFDAEVQAPLWYGGTHSVTFLDFSLPSGLHNVWGCGNDFDTDSARIHPDDLVEIMRSLTREA